MNREQARREIDSLDYYLQNHTDDYGEESHTAMMMAIKSLEQQPCDVSKLTQKAYEDGKKDGYVQAKAEQQPCEDAISRQVAIDAAIEAADEWDGGYNISREEIIAKALEQLPSVSTEKTGRWERVPYDSNPNIGNWHCSECNRIVCGAVTAASPVYSYKYCPNCGARMGEDGDKD